MFIGPADRVEIAGYVYTVLARQLKAAGPSTSVP